MRECIEETKILIKYQLDSQQICNYGKPFSEYQKVYSWTNEFIAAYLKLVNFNDKKSALAVMASGDHAFNLITNGIKTVDTFDTNRLTEYYALGFKRAMILKYDYQTFISKMTNLYSDNVSIEYISDIILELLPFMEYKYADYWESIIDFNFKEQKDTGTNLNLFKMLTLSNNMNDMTVYNNYLTNEENYEILRKKIGMSMINFKCTNAIDLTSSFSCQYDFILLSNILDYFSKRWNINWNYEKLREYEKELEKIIAEDGVIFLKYIYNYGVSDKIIRKHAIIGDSSVTLKNLTDEEVCKLEKKPNTNVFDGMILKKIR